MNAPAGDSRWSKARQGAGHSGRLVLLKEAKMMGARTAGAGLSDGGRGSGVEVDVEVVGGVRAGGVRPADRQKRSVGVSTPGKRRRPSEQCGGLVIASKRSGS